ncbi:unnamed protein product [Pipistrellus nathusii]|uniref:Adhesion G-protein coupled receptor G7 n=1 Tax=Pipistrellus nathusii TaxID=59473 RepID=A0ABN9ZTM2_PIPNA
MAACRVCDLRVLVAIVCGLLTAVTLGLTIWMAVKILTATPSSSGRPFKGDCRNGGTWQNGTCLCTENWKGLRCTIINFCENSTSGGFTFDNISVGRYGPSLEKCDKDTLNAGSPRATRLCNLTEDGEIELQNATIANCNTNLETLEKELNDSSANASAISGQVLILTSNSENLKPQNITSATKVVGQILNITTNDSSQAKIDAVATVSQLLDANEGNFQKAVAEDEQAFSMLVTQMETYSWSLGNNSVVNPNIAIQSVSLHPEDTGGSTGVLFTVDKGASDSLVSGSTSVELNKDGVHPNKTTELQIWLNTPKINATSYGFIVYQNSKLFPSKIFKSTSNYSIRVVSSTANNTGNNQNTSVQMAFRKQYTEKKLQSFACVYWNFTKKDWDTDGCFKDGNKDEVLYCRCNHTTNFAVLMSFTEANYPGLNELTTVGCALSITGLILTIIFQIVTRKVRKTSVTWVLVSLCTSMLIFNLLFVTGIENKNKDKNSTDENNEIPQKIPPNRLCTAVAILLHYFLLAMFTWTGVSAVQLYFLLIRTMKPLPQRFTLYMSLIGWGVPALMVAMTVGIIFSQDSSEWDLNYRQEKICWLALPKENEFEKSPFLWSLILPVAIILTNNVVLYIIIIVKVVWKNDQNLTSTKKVSLLKKVFSTLSIAVIFGITWILGFVMLSHDEKFKEALSYIFCIFNTTQGLQIFILYTVRTKIFQNEAAKMLKLLSSSADRVKFLPSKTGMRLRARMYNMLSSFPALNERFRLLEPAVVTEEMTLSESDPTSISI